MARTARPAKGEAIGDLPAGTRERMLQMAIEAIERGGEASVRVREVSHATGVSFASLYHFFGSREGLVEEALAEIYVRSMREFTVAIAARINQCDDVEGFRLAIREMSLAAYDLSRSSLRFTRLSVLGGVAGRPQLAARVAAVQQSANEALAAVIRPPQERGWIHPKLDLNTFAAWMTGLTLGRSLIELDPGGTDGAAWNEMSVAALLAVSTGNFLD